MPDVRDARGLIPSRTMDGRQDFHILDYRVSANNLARIMRGDIVQLDANGDVQWVNNLTTAAQRAPIGVVAYCLGADRRPLTFNQPTRGPYILTSTDGYVGVYVDPNIIYNVQCDATASRANVGSYIGVTAGAGNTAAGYSTTQVRFADVTTTSVGHYLQIVGISPDELTDNYEGGAAGVRNLEVRFSRHRFNTPRSVIDATVA